MMSEYVIGIDLGATKTLVLACDASGNILHETWQQTHSAEGKEAAIEMLLSVIDELRRSPQLQQRVPIGIGAGCAGLVNFDEGVLRDSIMLQGWVEVPLQKILEENTGLPARIDNDANAAAYGEWWVGAGRGTSNMVCLTIGTGVGGGLIINKKLYRGADGTAAEFGNMTIDYDGPLCACGSRGCLNPLASGTAIASRAREGLERAESSIILQKANWRIDQVTTKMVLEAAREGDVFANQLISETAVFLGAAIANLVNALNPDAVILSGGVMEQSDLLINRIRAEVNHRAFKLPATRAKILPAALGNRAGAVGAAGILLDALRSPSAGV